MLKSGFAQQAPLKKKGKEPLGDFFETKFGWKIHQGLNVEPEKGSKV